MLKRAEPPPPEGWTAKEWDKHLNRKEKKGFYGTLYPNAGEKLSEFDDTIFSEDPTRMMPRLRQIHKLGYTLQGHDDVQGLRVAIENRKGSVRKGTDSDGNEWRTKMKYPYGYLVGTKGADGEPVDCYVGPDKEAPAAFVVHQHKDTGKGYDEDKVMLGFPSKKAAKEAYLMHYDDPKFLGPMAKVSMDRLRELVASKKRLVKISHVQGQALMEELMAIQKTAQGTPDVVRQRERGKLIRKAGPGIGGLLGAGVGALVGARRGQLLKGTIAGLGTGATLGWVPDMYHSAREAIHRYRSKVQ